MKRIEVKLSLPIVAPLLDVIRELALELEDRLAVDHPIPESDPDFQDAWRAELLQTQTADVRALLSLFDGNFFADGVVGLDEDTCEPIVRATAVLRLRLRERRLAALSDDQLEAGDVDPDRLEESIRKAFLCYLFLATLQELIVQNLDSSAIDRE